MSDTTGDTSHNTTDVSHDTTVDVTTAAEVLGISEEAVRARIRRGKLDAEKVGALWRVHLPNGDPLVTPNTTVSSRNTTSCPTTGRVTQHDTTPRDSDLEPLAAVIRDQNHRIEELAAAAAMWQTRAAHLEDQLKQLPAGETTTSTLSDAPGSPKSDDQPVQGVNTLKAWWRRLWGS